MSLYNQLFGENAKSDILLKCLGLTREDCGRYRDCYQREGHIVIHTRNGGGNRETYQDVIDQLATHPCYVRDEDDDFDCTYADIFFRYPDDYVQDLNALEQNLPDVRPSEKWQAMFPALNGNAKSGEVE